MLKVSKLLCCAPKKNSSKGDYEDAFTAPKSINISEKIVKVAVADGATESSFSREWSNLLVNKYTGDQFNLRDENYRKTIIGEWEERIGKNKLTWFGAEKLSKGAFSTFLGLSLDLENDKWKAESIGDSCFFIIREGKLLQSFPVVNSSEFNSNPYLLSSKEENNKFLDKNIKNSSGTLLAGDLLILATDALAFWFLKEVEDSKQPWIFFLQLIDDRQKLEEKKILFKNWSLLKDIWVKSNNIIDTQAFDLFIREVFDKSDKNNEIEQWSFKNWLFSNWLDKIRNMRYIKNDDTTLYMLKIY